MLNEELVKRQKLSEDRVAAIKELHSVLAQVLARPTMFGDEKEIPAIIEGIEYALQGLWGFHFDSKRHTYWNKVIGCLCSQMDNDDMYGTGLRWTNAMCPFHGSLEEYENDALTDKFKRTGRW